MAKIKPIQFDYDGALIPENGITESQIEHLAPQLEAARDEVLKTDLQLFTSGEKVPSDKDPLDSGFHELPERLLEAYQSNRAGSELGGIL